MLPSAQQATGEVRVHPARAREITADAASSRRSGRAVGGAAIAEQREASKVGRFFAPAFTGAITPADSMTYDFAPPPLV